MSLTLLYKFTRESVLARDHSRFLTRFWPATLPEGAALRQYMGHYEFCVSGYDEDPRELFVIPEVKTFFRDFRVKWPFWLFACNLDLPSLRTLTFCCLDSLTLTPSQGGESWCVNFSLTELASFLHEELRKLEATCQRAGMSTTEIVHRCHRAQAYFCRQLEQITPPANPNSPKHNRN